MVPETLIGRFILAEAFVPTVVVRMDGGTLPIGMALDAEMVVALGGQGGAAGTGLQQALGQGDTGRNAAALHFRHSHGGILVYILLLYRLGRCSKAHEQSKKDCELFHLLSFNRSFASLRMTRCVIDKTCG